MLQFSVMAFIDYYTVLGLDKTASEADVKKAYRKLARKLHPDLNPTDKQAQTKFQAINEANEVLSDQVKRKKYDRFGKDWEHGEEFEQQRRDQEARGGRTAFANNDDSDFSSFFESMFGASQGRGNAPRTGQDLHATMQLGLKDILESHKETITVNGKQIRVTIPAGIANDQVLKLKGHGVKGINGGADGDLIINFEVKDFPGFERKGNDLYCQTSISLYKAVLGGDTTIDTLNGKVKMKIRAGTQNGERIRLKGKGIPAYKKEKEMGDLYVSFQVSIPQNLSPEQVMLFEQLMQMD
ncbi:MAG TPA: J domain-containing protein [Sediminibacterium sp.]|jgi:curved DNA-binding protein|nr:J domain-containing protein [Sediminibacterium sp.]HQS55304.1 J domain-containing protein [Sediminibacterium sp.]